jgi:GNAT superfamily N-acetyltransferase
VSELWAGLFGARRLGGAGNESPASSRLICPRSGGLASAARAHAAIGRLQAAYLTPEAVAASFSIMGLDSQLIADQGYFLVGAGDRIAGCGGWSRRATLFGGDHSAGRDAALLDPAKDPARVRAMYTHPDFARRGIGRMILGACEAAAAAEGFKACELAATLAGEPLYLACGYHQIERFAAATADGPDVPLVRMGKTLSGPGGR